MVRRAREAGFKRSQVPFIVFPGSGGVKRLIESADRRLGGESVAEVLRSIGGGDS